VTDLLPGFYSATYSTPRLATHVLSGPGSGVPVVLVHGNCSSGRFFEETIAALPRGYRGLAPDLRGYGGSEAKPVDATRGVRDFSDDLHALFTSPELRQGGAKVHLVGWSLGGSVVMQYAIDHAADVASITLIAPTSPFGFGGTRPRGRALLRRLRRIGRRRREPRVRGRLGAGDTTDESDSRRATS
jgi:pimeloyl-ACP methyl ester carboxylesterase